LVAGSFSGIQGIGAINDTFSTANGFITVPQAGWSGVPKKGDVFTFVGTIGTSVDPNLPATIALTVNPQSLVANGSSTAALTSVVRDAYGNLVLPTTVDFSVSPSNLGSINLSRTLTVSGMASTLVTSSQGQQGYATLTASVVSANGATVASSVSIFFIIDGSKNMMVRIEGGPSIFVPAGSLPPNIMIEARKPSDAKAPGRPPTEDMSGKIDEANQMVEEGTTPDVVPLDIEDNVWQFTAWTDGQTYSGQFNDKGVQLRIPYPDEDPEDGIVDGTEVQAKWVKIFWLNDRKEPAEWEVVESELHAEVKEIWAWVPHFSVYALQGISPPIRDPKSLKYVAVYPNPFVLSEGNVLTFINLPNPFDVEFIRLYNLAGELVYEMTTNDVRLATVGNEYRGYSVAWDGRTRNGRKVASGIYIYVIKAKNEDKPKVGKVGVVK